jgi:hypothetical protein
MIRTVAIASVADRTDRLNDRRERQQDKANLSRDKRLGDKATIAKDKAALQENWQDLHRARNDIRQAGMCGTTART